MPVTYADRVRETTVTTGTGALTLAGAATGFQTFNSALGVGPTFYYSISKAGSTDWEVGEGVLSGATTLVRTTVLASSNSGALVSLGAGTKDVILTVAAAGLVPGAGSVTSVAASVPSIFSIAGSPITGAGTLAMTYSGTALPVANGGLGLTAGTSGGIPGYTATGTIASSAALTLNALVLGGGAGSTPKVAAGLTTDGTSALNLGVAGTSVGKVVLSNATSGTITVQPVTGALGTVTLTAPAITDTLVTLTATQTLTNKSFTAPALGTPVSGTLTNCTGLPVSTGISGLAAGIAAFLATPSSANLITAVTNESGTGALLFAGGAFGTPSSLTLTNATGLPVAGGGTGVASLTAYGPVFGGTTSTGAVQSGGVGTAGQVLVSNGAGALPTIKAWYRPQNSKSTAYTTVLADGGAQILHPSADTTARVFTVDSNANVAYPLGTEMVIINQDAAGVLTIAITADTMRLEGAGTTGSRTLAANGIATLRKVATTEWIISGGASLT